MNQTALRVLVVDDNALVREALCELLWTEADIEVVCQASNGKDAVRLAKKHQPDLVLLDIAMPEMNGIDAARWIKAQLPDTQVLIFSQLSSVGFAKEALAAGASGYIAKENAVSDLMPEVRKIQQMRARPGGS